MLDLSRRSSDVASLAEPREFVRVRPTTDRLGPRTAQTLLTKLHALSSTDAGGVFSGDSRPTIEVYLVSPAGRHRVDWLFTVDGGRIETLRQLLDAHLPTGYAVRDAETTSLQAALLGEAVAAPTEMEGATDDGETATDLASDGGAATAATRPLVERPAAAMEVYAEEARPGDYRTRLTPVSALRDGTDEAESPWPLAAVITALGRTALPAICQTLLRPLPDWSRDRDQFEYELRHTRDESVFDRFYTFLETTPPQDRERPGRADRPASVRRRLDDLEAVEPGRSFAINTRVVAFAEPDGEPSPRAALVDLRESFTAVSGETYRLTPAIYPTDSRAARHCRDELATRTLRGVTRGRQLLGDVWPVGRFTSAAQPRIVADVATAGAFCLVGGAGLPEAARRAIAARPADRAPEPLPPRDVLDAFRTGGLQLGWPTDTNGEVVDDAAPLRLPPALQRRHVLFVGQTGAGKSRHGINALLPNHAATDGATILLELKDGQFAEEYCQAHYQEYGTLEDVYRFPAHEILPAAPVFDIGPELEAGMSREQAVQTAADRLVKVLKQSLGREAFEQAFTAERVIKTITKALYDHVHGDDSVTVQDIQAAITRLQESETPPPVADEHLRRDLSALLANNYDTFTEIMRGAARRLATVAADARVRPLFAYERDAGDYSDVEPFDWRAKLDEDCVVILDLSALEPEPTETLALVLLSQVWHALRRRDRERTTGDAAGDPPLVNLHVEEAADVAGTGMVRKFLKEGRGYGVAVSLSMQFLEQLRTVDEAAYQEVVNDVGTLLVGPVGHAPRLATRLAGSDVPATDVEHRLGALQPGEWLCWLASDHDVAVGRAFTVKSGPQPPGIAAGPEPLEGAQLKTYDAAVTTLRGRSRRYGLPIANRVAHTTEAGPGSDAAAAATPGDAAPAGGPSAADNPIPGGITATVGLTNRLPEAVEPAPQQDAFRCARCGATDAATLDGLRDAVDCCHDWADVPREAVPPVHVGCTVDWATRDRSDYTDAQFAFMQLLHNVRLGRYEPIEYDLVWDDMAQLVSAAGLDGAALDELIIDGRVKRDTDHPHTIYSLTAEGREAIDAAHREGIAHGDDVGDLGESTFHVMLVETMRRVFERWFVDDADHPGVEVRTYYGVDEGRLDVAVLDADGDVVVAGEAERSNNDTLEAAPADFDKMAACDPDQAIWLVKNRPAGHAVIRALHNARDGARVPTTYSDGTNLRRIGIDEPGFTDMYTIEAFRDNVLDDPSDG